MKNQEEMKKMLFTGVKLFLICAVSAISLSILNQFTKDPIDAHKIQAENEVRDKFVEVFKDKLNLTDCSAGEKVKLTESELEELKESGIETIPAYYPIVSNGKTEGYIVEFEAKGYGGPMKIMALYKSSGEIISAKLMDNEETPGLGKKAEDESYMNKFIGTGGPDVPVPVSKNMLGGSGGSSVQYERNWSQTDLSFSEWFFGKSEGSTDSVTGATITFNGVSSALAQGSLFIKLLEGV
jgi:Na+-translocating ferredoxin:NAD+ oxidoreductase subunit G